MGEEGSRGSSRTEEAPRHGARLMRARGPRAETARRKTMQRATPLTCLAREDRQDLAGEPPDRARNVDRAKCRSLGRRESSRILESVRHPIAVAVDENVGDDEDARRVHQVLIALSHFVHAVAGLVCGVRGSCLARRVLGDLYLMTDRSARMPMS